MWAVGRRVILLLESMRGGEGGRLGVDIALLGIC